MLPVFALDESLSRSPAPAIWTLWDNCGPSPGEFGVVVPLPNGRLALVPVTESGLDVEHSTYFRVDHPIFSSCRPDEPVLIPYSREDDTAKPVESEHIAWLRQALGRKKVAACP